MLDNRTRWRGSAAAARWICAAAAFAAPAALALQAAGQDELRRPASWTAPDSEQVRAQLDAWLDERGADEREREAVAALWPADETLAPDELLDRLTLCLAAVDGQARRLAALCRLNEPPLPLPDFPFLTDPSTPPLARNNLRLAYARWLTQHALYDEALQQLDGLAPGDVVDPAALLFYQSVARHRLLQKDACLSLIDQLLEREDAIPRRYRVVARLMQADLEPLKADSLDEVARLMDDVRRRLALQRAGRRVRDQEEKVIEKLDKMIKEMEEQLKRQQQTAQASSQMQPRQPMQDSMPGGGKGPGDVDPRKLGRRVDWGNLPPKEREEALQQISEELPAHYREVIEEYFRKIAREGGQ